MVVGGGEVWGRGRGGQWCACPGDEVGWAGAGAGVGAGLGEGKVGASGVGTECR